MIYKSPKGGIFVKTSSKVKLFIILGVEFIAIVAMLLLIFLSGKQTYTVRFDLNGGTLLSGDLEQSVRQGNAATPPNVTKDGCYFLKWSTSYSKVTKDLVIEAIWEYETTPGIRYNIPANSNYCTIAGGFEGLQGEVYIGGYNGNWKVLGIEPGAFKNCTGITKIHLLEGILTIGEGAFEGCTSMTSIDLPETVAVLGENAFKDCTSLTEITIPKDLKELSANTFLGCTALETVNFPEEEVEETEGAEEDKDEESVEDSVADTSVEEEAEEVIAYSTVLTSIGNSAFEGCTALKSVKIPESVATIGGSAFKNCSALTEVVLPKQLKSLSASIFYGCTALESITFPEALESIGASAFRSCAALKEVVIPAGVTTLGNSSFRDCTSLEKVVLNEGLETIYAYAFSGCIALKEMTLPSTITGVGTGAFENTQLVFEEGYPELEEKLPFFPFDPGIIRPIEPDFPIRT